MSRTAARSLGQDRAEPGATFLPAHGRGDLVRIGQITQFFRQRPVPVAEIGRQSYVYGDHFTKRLLPQNAQKQQLFQTQQKRGGRAFDLHAGEVEEGAHGNAAPPCAPENGGPHAAKL